ncbi:MAG: hypothetical protein ACSHYB_15230 [Roseibacillus sp.]
MKTAFHMSLLLTALFFAACREKTESPKESSIDQVRFTPQEGEKWVYKVEISLDPTARVPSGVIDAGPEGSESTYQKERVYLGQRPVKEGSKEMAHCFEISKNGRKQEQEFSLINGEGILSRAWQEAGKERIIMDPILLVPAKKVPGAVWDASLPNPNDPGGPPMFYRRFHYYGIEEIQVMGQPRRAHRVKVLGKTGPLQLQRDFWFVDQLGFVKERKAYYSEESRLALVEESLVEHVRPEK